MGWERLSLAFPSLASSSLAFLTAIDGRGGAAPRPRVLPNITTTKARRNQNVPNVHSTLNSSGQHAARTLMVQDDFLGTPILAKAYRPWKPFLLGVTASNRRRCGGAAVRGTTMLGDDDDYDKDIDGGGLSMSDVVDQAKACANEREKGANPSRGVGGISL